MAHIRPEPGRKEPDKKPSDDKPDYINRQQTEDKEETKQWEQEKEQKGSDKK